MSDVPPMPQRPEESVHVGPEAGPAASTGAVDFRPVILGADIGVYALARSFHELYGVTSAVVSSRLVGAISSSRIIDNVLVGPEAGPEELVEHLCSLAEHLKETEPPRPLLLMANSDWLVQLVVEHRARLEEHYVVPFLGQELLDRLSDKARFAEVCAEVGVAVPRTLVQDFAGAGEPDWSPSPVDLPFPLIAKAASSAEYQDVHFEGKKKVFQIDDQAELDELWSALAGAGFRGRFIAQELIPGDDTQMRSITAYVDRAGRVTLLCSARVLLEEHTPSGLGNPAAMITERFEDMLDQAKRLLEHTGYVGFANFDVKIDPRDGTARFFEVNPRIGRNNYYVTAAGSNPMRFVVEDWLQDREVEPVVVEREVLYSILPHRLLLKYVLDAQLRAKVVGLIRAGRTVHPLRNPADRTWRRQLYIRTALTNQVRKFRRYYPEVTGTGF